MSLFGGIGEGAISRGTRLESLEACLCSRQLQRRKSRDEVVTTKDARSFSDMSGQGLLGLNLGSWELCNFGVLL
jgi:hypothetical protein